MKMGRSLLGAMLALSASAASAQMQNRSDQLLEAIRYGEMAKVQDLIKAEPVIVNSRSQVGETPLMLAIEQRSVPLIGFLLFHKANPEQTDGKGETPLIAAARKGWGEGVDGLLEMGAKVDGRNRQGETALIVAVQARSVRVVRQLLAKGANPDIADRIAGFSARDYAKRETRTPELARLIDQAKTAKP